jgi:hypothetical protein
MNHVQILHAGEVQNLHVPGVQNLHAGSLDANFACLPGVEICRQARMQKMSPGQSAKIAFWRE